MAPGYGINSISYANDPYFMYALNSYNPNFMGMQQTQTTQTQTTQQTTNPSFQGNTQNLPKADYSEDSNTGLVVGGLTIAAGAAALIYAGRKGKLGGIKKFLGFGSNEKSATNLAEELKNKITVKYNKSGNLVYTIPGKTTSINGLTDIQKFAKDNNIPFDDLIKFTKENSTIKGGSFKFTDNGIDNVVTFKDGKIIDINNGTSSIKNILESTDSNDIKFVEKLEKEIAKIYNQEKGWNQNLKELEYSTKIGDDILTLTRNMNGAGKTRLERLSKMQLTSLERFSQDSDMVKAYLHDNDSARIFVSENLRKGKLPENLKIVEFSNKYNKNTICHFGENGKLIGITENGKFYNNQTDKFKAFEYDNNSTVQKMVAKILKNNNIPDGAILTLK